MPSSQSQYCCKRRRYAGSQLKAERLRENGWARPLGQAGELELLELLASALIEREVSRRGQRSDLRLDPGRAVELRRGDDAAETDGRDRHRRGGRSEAQANLPPDASNHDALERLTRSCPQRAREAVHVTAELTARPAALEMVLEQGTLERRQFPVDDGRCPLAGPLTVSLHGPHSTFDGGGVQKLDQVIVRKASA